MRGFDAENIDFAFPSRTLYMANDDKRQLKLMVLKGQQPDPDRDEILSIPAEK
jgi:MscS family membrane protein